MTRLAYGLVLALGLGAMPAFAQSALPDLIGKYRDWTAYEVTERGVKTCYMISEPTDSKPEGVNRGDIHFFVSHRPAQKVESEINIQIGYPFKAGSLGSLKIGGAKFQLYTANQDAWLEDAKDEPRALNAMRKGSDMIISGESKRGTRTTDTYSLLGFTAALNAINKACGVR